MLKIEKRKAYCPIIIPGIEFTVNFPEYKGRCHILKYFFDVDNEEFTLNVKK